MKATGIIRRIDPLGRVVIPSELRKAWGIQTNDPLEIYTEDGKIIFKPYDVKCACCGEEDVDKLKVLNEVRLCPVCINEFGGNL